MKKLSLLLASIGAGLLLVGGTVAAFIVTSADQLGVRVSPGSIDTDKRGRVTLSWGANTTHPVGNLVPGAETEVGQVVLAAASDSEDYEGTYTGVFSVAVTNMSKPSANNLMNYLDVKVYKSTSGLDTGFGEATAFPSPQADTGGYLAKSYADEAAVSGYRYKITVTLNASAGDDFYPALLTQTAYATFNWGPSSTDIDADSLETVYYAVNPLAASHELYVHIYKGNAAAADYPGIKMTYEYDIAGGKQLYSASFDREKYDSFKFIDHTSTSNEVIASVTKQFAEDDLAPYYVSGTTWDQRPPEALAMYYVRGTVNGQSYWSSNEKALAFTQNTEVGKSDEWIIEGLKFYDKDAFKIYVPGTDDWFVTGGVDFSITEQGEYTGIGTPGVYKICVTNNVALKGEGWADCTSDKSATYYMFIAKTADLPA